MSIHKVRSSLAALGTTQQNLPVGEVMSMLVRYSSMVPFERLILTNIELSLTPGMFSPFGKVHSPKRWLGSLLEQQGFLSVMQATLSPVISVPMLVMGIILLLVNSLPS